jgi:hypothetical protein
MGFAPFNEDIISLTDASHGAPAHLSNDRLGYQNGITMLAIVYTLTRSLLFISFKAKWNGYDFRMIRR